MEQAVRAAQAGAQAPIPQPQERALFGVKVRYDDEAKEVEGTAAVLDTAGRLVIFDGDKVVARFDDEKVERWWKEKPRPLLP